MRSTARLLVLVVAVGGTSLALSLPITTFADGNAAPASPLQNPAREKKIWTNDDFPPAESPSAQATQKKTADAAGASLAKNQAPAAVPAKTAVTTAPLPQEQDPQWYAQQFSALNQQLSQIETQEQQLRNFRATDQGLPTGLNIYAPTQGVGTDNLIAELDTRRQEILQQIDALSDTARANGLPPGVLQEPVAAPELSPEQQRAALADTLSQQQDDLAKTQAVVESMQQDAQAMGITLSQPSQFGGNLTTNLLQGLDDRAAALQNDINNTQDEARAAGVAATTQP
jgi:hypothetical protein